jgi:hypothetical protein
MQRAAYNSASTDPFSSSSSVRHCGSAGKTLLVMALQQMCQLMHKDVFQTLNRLFCQLQIEPNAPGLDVARTTFDLHSFNAPGTNRNAQDWLP